MPSVRRTASPAFAGAVILLVVLLVACSSPAASSAPLTVSGAWVRSVAIPNQPTAAYLTISNGSGQSDALVGASSPDAASVELHQTMTDASGMTGMQAMDRLEVPPEGEVSLQPGGNHLMVMGLSHPLATGGRLELDLQFEHAGKVVVMAEVRDG